MLANLGLATRAPFHILLFSLTFGGGFFHSFIVSPIAFKHLEREQFGKLQNKIFPFFFLGQTLSPIVLALTSPITLTRVAIGLLSVSAVSGAANYFWLLPLCKKLKEDRVQLIAENRHEIVEDGVTHATAEFERATKQFGKYHGISTLVNMVSIATIGAYGVVLSKGFAK